LIAVIFVNFARIFVFQAFKIPTGSMIDNLLIGDHIIVNKFVYGPPGGDLFNKAFPFRRVERGDVVVFRFPEDPRTDFVKRVVAVGGETITIRDKQVFINGKRLDEPYVIHLDEQVYPRLPALPDPLRSRDQFGPYLVPPGSFFVMGDNRDSSNDSRYWGPVSRELIKGKAFLVYWSFRGNPPPPGSPPSARVRELLDVALHFFSRTRWDRTFLVVDSKYHYHAEPVNLDQYGYE
ncbi:MAG TPA: signal peptidase I, partial [Thermoanaerobaculia bacterium]|nr:signal peptidase I [Thermoanaerobaculia bacterium]